MPISKPNYFYDENKVRYTLVSTLGEKPLNWLFFPGGPGADSSYFLALTELIQFPGNTWLIDLPGNGSHNICKEGFDNWVSIFLPTIRRFQNPIIVGHSFGGMLPLMYEELEDLLKGLIIFNSTPRMWLEEAAKYAKDHKLPDLTNDMKVFTESPNQDSFDKALAACTPYYFSPDSLGEGLKMLESIPFSFEPAVWWQRKAFELQYSAFWIPKRVQTLIIGGEFDGITPFTLFENDKRFDRENIQKVCIANAGHFPWFEQPEKVRELIIGFQNILF